MTTDLRLAIAYMRHDEFVAVRVTRLRLGTVVAFAATGLVFSALAAFLLNQGLDRADQWSSVIAGVVGASSLAASGYGWVVGRRPEPPRAVRSALQSTAWGSYRMPEDLSRLLAAQSRAAQSVPYRVPGLAGMPMAAMYVRQDLETYRQPVADSAPADPIGAERVEVRSAEQMRLRILPAAQRVEQVLDRHRHLLIEGGPGLGKSSLARDIAGRLAKSWLSPTGAAAPTSTPVLPLLVSARSLSRHRGLPWMEALAQAYAEALGQHADHLASADLLATPPIGVGWMVIIDGLDEVTEPQRDALVDVVAERMAQPDQPFRIILLSRPVAAGTRQRIIGADVGIYTLLPFSRAALHDFVTATFTAAGNTRDRDLPERFMRQLHEADLMEVATVPLLATIAITVYATSPTRRLPRTRYELYEQYIAHLAETSSGRRRDLRTRLRHRLAETPGGPAAVEAVFDRSAQLVEHLAVCQVDTEQPLADVAIAWCRSEDLFGSAMLPRARDLVIDVLTGTGLLIRRDADVAFIHHTFAEHFAADRLASLLPARFDHRAPGWRMWIDRGVSGDEMASAVLLRWTHRTSDPSLVDWLQGGSASHQSVAARLIADGAVATEPQVATCLAQIGYRWSTYGSNGFLAKLIRRLPRTGVVREWAREHAHGSRHGPELQAVAARLVADDPGQRADDMAAIVRRRLDDELLPPARTALAEALAGLAPACTSEAATALREALRDPLATPQQRVATAEALAGLGPGHRGELEDEFRALVAEAALRPVDLAAIARVLAEVQPDCRGEATSLIRAALVHPETQRLDRPVLAQLLVELDQASATAVETLLAVARDPYLDAAPDRTEAARILGDVGAAERRAAATVLSEIADTPRNDSGWARRAAASALAEFGVEHHGAAAAAVEAVLADPTGNAWQYRIAAQALLRLPRAYHDAAIAALRAEDGDVSESRQVCTAAARAVLDPSWALEAAETLRSIAADPFADSNSRHEAAVMLAGLGAEEFDDGCAALQALTQCGVGWARAYAAYWLAIVRPQWQPLAGECFRRILLDPRIDPGRNGTAARMAVEVIPADRELAVGRLLAAFHSPRLWPFEYRHGTDKLAMLGRPEYVQILDVLTRVALDDTVVPLQRVRSCASLVRRGADQRRIAHRVASTVAHDPHVEGETRVAAAGILGQTSAGRDPAVAALSAVLADPHAPTAARIAANAELDRLDLDGRSGTPAGRTQRIEAARRLVAEPDTPPQAALDAIDWLSLVGTHDATGDHFLVAMIDVLTDPLLLYRAVAASSASTTDGADRAWRLLRQRIDDPYRTVEDIRAASAAALALGPRRTAEMERELGALLSDTPYAPHQTVALAAGLLEVYSPTGEQLSSLTRRNATHALRRLLDQQHIDPAIRVKAVQALASVEATRSLAATAAARLLDDPRLTAAERCALAEVVGDADPNETAARACLADIVLDRQAPRHSRHLAALALGGIHPNGRAELADHLDELRANTDATERLLAASVSYRLAPDQPEEALAELRDVADAGTPDIQWAAAQSLADIHTGREAAAAALVDIAHHTPLSIPDLCRVARLMATLGPDARDQAAAEIISRLAGAQIRADERRTAATTLAGLSPVYRDVAAAQLHADAQHAAATPRRLRAITAVAQLSPSLLHQAVSTLRAMIRDSGLRPAGRLHAALELARISRQHRNETTQMLTAALSDEELPLALRLRTACRLVDDRIPGWRAAVPPLARYMTGTHAPIYLRRQAAQTLLRLGAAQRLPAADTLLSICSDPDSHCHDRVEAAAELCRDGTHTETAIDILRHVALDNSAPADVRRRAAVTLCRHTAARVPDMLGVLRDIHADAGAAAVVRASAAADLGAISPQAAAEAAALLTEDLDSGTLRTQIAAARSLGRLDEASRARAIDHLDSLTSRPTTPTRSLAWIHHVRRGINRLTELGPTPYAETN